jgi:hypothetical protein
MTELFKAALSFWLFIEWRFCAFLNKGRFKNTTGAPGWEGLHEQPKNAAN